MALLRRGAASAVELAAESLRRAERTHDSVNAVVWWDEERALRGAVLADRRRRRGDRGRLLGLPVTVKESIMVDGSPVTLGDPELATSRSAADSPLVARLRAAGAVVVGKTNLARNLDDWQADNPVYGRTNNPLDRALTPGGSSGGGAAVAAGVTPLDIGTDLIGSVRVPAAFCGVAAHRPSDGLLPRLGQVPGDPPPTLLSVYGPIAAHPEDLRLAVVALAGADPEESGAWSVRLPRPRAARLSDFRVAVLPLPSWPPVAAAVVEAIDQFAGLLRGAGARVEVAAPDGLHDLTDLASVALSLVTAVTRASLGALERRSLAAAAARRGVQLDDAYAAGLQATASSYLGWQRARSAYRARLRAFFAQYDVLVTPITLTPPYPHVPGASVWPTPLRDAPSLLVDGARVFYGHQCVHPAIASVPGHGATALRIGRTPTGLPVAAQVVGPYLEDLTTLEFAQLATCLVTGC